MFEFRRLYGTRKWRKLTLKYPERIDMMAALGFTPLANLAIRKTVGRIKTIPKGVEMAGVSMEKIVSVLKENGFTIAETANADR